MNDPIIEFFEWYELHDTPIETFSFDFSSQTLSLKMEDYDDLVEKPVAFCLLFKKLKKFTFDYPTEDFYFEIKDIYSAKLRKLAEKEYELSLVVTLPEKTTKLEYDVGKMLIGFADMEVIGGLSREAMEYKYQIEE